VTPLTISKIASNNVPKSKSTGEKWRPKKKVDSREQIVSNDGDGGADQASDNNVGAEDQESQLRVPIRRGESGNRRGRGDAARGRAIRRPNRNSGVKEGIAQLADQIRHEVQQVRGGEEGHREFLAQQKEEDKRLAEEAKLLKEIELKEKTLEKWKKESDKLTKNFCGRVITDDPRPYWPTAFRLMWENSSVSQFAIKLATTTAVVYLTHRFAAWIPVRFIRNTIKSAANRTMATGLISAVWTLGWSLPRLRRREYYLTEAVRTDEEDVRMDAMSGGDMKHQPVMVDCLAKTIDFGIIEHSHRECMVSLELLVQELQPRNTHLSSSNEVAWERINATTAGSYAVNVEKTDQDDVIDTYSDTALVATAIVSHNKFKREHEIPFPKARLQNDFATATAIDLARLSYQPLVRLSLMLWSKIRDISTWLCARLYKGVSDVMSRAFAFRMWILLTP